MPLIVPRCRLVGYNQQIADFYTENGYRGTLSHLEFYRFFNFFSAMLRASAVSLWGNFLIRSGGGGTGWVFSAALLQMVVPDKYRGRVFAFDFAVFTFASIMSTLWGGFASDALHFTPRQIALTSTITIAVITVRPRIAGQ